MPTVLVTTTGEDRPGITAGLLEVLAASSAEVLDMEQVVIRGQLTLGLVTRFGEDDPVLKDLLYYGYQAGVEVQFEPIEGDEDRTDPHRSRYVVTIIGHTLSAAVFKAVADAIAGHGANIDRIVRLSTYPVRSYEFEVSGGSPDDMRRALLEVARTHQVDVAVQVLGLERRAKRIVVLDMDSTLIQDEVIDLLAEEAGVEDRVKDITSRAMAGELDFSESLRERVALLEGMTVEQLERVKDRIRLTPGARTFIRTLHRLGFKAAVVSGGFSYFTDWVAERLALDHAHANELEIVDGRLTGKLVGTIVDGPGKAELLRHIAEHDGIPREQVVAVGDGANDLDMLEAAGLGIAFNAKPIVRDAADTALNVPYLDAILFFLGIRRDEVEANST
ncbi:MAG: phosphoserine phosphatase SerB [Acidimicrobiia bacterium]|jgi:phosphoserine phosphatase|nr:MAG: phosphoserine phosphatase SerB [Acidimicrobiia bacterium]